MNLTSDPWIPVVWQDGRADKVSLRDAFLRGREIRDLAVRPHERIALMRLLICVAQAALDGPKDRAEWKTCADRLPHAAAAYLDKWKHAFELFGDGPRFLQVRELAHAKAKGDEDGNPLSKLDMALASGRNSTLFDNAGGISRFFDNEVVVLMLLTFQCFSPGGLIGDVLWNDESMGRSSNHAPCVVNSLAHAYLLGSNLSESLIANLLTRETIQQHGYEWGKPIWEMMPKGPADTFNSCSTYLGRLVPLSRVVLIGDNGGMLLGNGLTYAGFPAWREPAATIIIKREVGKEERQTLKLSATKGIWREVPAISVLDRTGREPGGGPLSLKNLEQGQSCDLWVGGLIAAKAKLIDTVESIFHLPAAMFQDAGRQPYQDGVRLAEARAARLGYAISCYRRTLKDELEGEMWKRGAMVKQKASAHYWTEVEQRVPALLALVENPGMLYPEGSSTPDWGQTEWGKTVVAAARAAYELACPHNTPRQLKAYALGLKALFHGKPGIDETELEDTEDQDE